jgi:hypothetical protein
VQNRRSITNTAAQHFIAARIDAASGGIGEVAYNPRCDITASREW